MMWRNIWCFSFCITHDKDVLMGIAAECTMKLVSGEIAKDDAKSWCDNRAALFHHLVVYSNRV